MMNLNNNTAVTTIATTTTTATLAFALSQLTQSNTIIAANNSGNVFDAIIAANNAAIESIKSNITMLLNTTTATTAATTTTTETTATTTEETTTKATTTAAKATTTKATTTTYLHVQTTLDGRRNWHCLVPYNEHDMEKFSKYGFDNSVLQEFTTQTVEFTKNSTIVLSLIEYKPKELEMLVTCNIEETINGLEKSLDVIKRVETYDWE